ncbi:hypothetical protein V6760_01440 [Acinetobacter venetianus]
MKNKIVIPMVLGGIICIYVLYLMGWTPVYTLDDAYIVQHSVNNFVNFKSESVFLDSAKNSGLTSIVHVGLITLIAFVFDTNWSQFLIASLSYILFLVAIFLYSFKSTKNIVTSFCLTLLAAVSGYVIEQFFNGLETGLLIFLVTISLILFRNGVPQQKLAFALLPVLPFVRPELSFLSTIICVRAAFFYFKNNQKSEFSRAFFILVIASAMVAIYAIILTGNILPNTAGAKSYFFAESCKQLDEKIRVLNSGIGRFLSSLGVLSLGFIAILFTRLRFVFLTFISIFYILYLLEFSGGIHHNNYRYQYVFYAFAIIGLIDFLSLNLVAKYSKYLSLLMLVLGLYSVPKNIHNLNTSIQFTQNENFTVGEWVKENISKNDVILIHDAGYISTVTNSKLVDIVGLKTSYSAQVNKVTRLVNCGNDPRAIDAIATKFNAKYFVVFGMWDDIFQLTNSLKVMGWKVEVADKSRDGAAYRVYKISK